MVAQRRALRSVVSRLARASTGRNHSFERTEAAKTVKFREEFSTAVWGYIVFERCRKELVLALISGGAAFFQSDISTAVPVALDLSAFGIPAALLNGGRPALKYAGTPNAA